MDYFERYCNTMPVSGFNSAKYNIILIKPYLLPILLNERQIEPTVIKKANQFVSFKFGDVQLLDIMNFLGGAFSLDSFLKTYKTEETKGFSPMSGSTFSKQWTTKNYLHTIPSLANSVNLILSRKFTTTLESSILVVYRQSKQYASYDSKKYLQQVMKITLICGGSGWAKEWNLLKTFLYGTKTKILFQH